MTEPTLLARVRTRGWYRPLARAPMLAFRLGMRPLVGRAFLVLTTTGRKSGTPRHTMTAYGKLDGRKYAVAAYGNRSHWYRNLSADPRVTLQTSDGTESVSARRLTEDAEITRVLMRLRAKSSLLEKTYLASQASASVHELLAHKDRAVLVTFDPTSERTPPGLKADLVWIWPAAALLVWVWRRRARA